jgi:hypothetical protein
MGFSPIHHHKYRKQLKADTPLGPNRGTEELLRNVLGPDFYGYDSKNGENSYLIDSERQNTQSDVVTVAQQSQNTKKGPIKELPKPVPESVKELAVRYILGLHEAIIESNL